jgi:preprotein translocase subunit Sec63
MSYSALFKKAARLLQSYLNNAGESQSGYRSSSNYRYSNTESSTNSSYNHSSYSSKGNENKNQNHQKSQSNYKEQHSSKNASLKDEFYYYNVLGLSKGATVNDIKKAYKTLISQYHPDKVSTLGSDLQNLAQKKTQEINEAYQYFKNKFNF